MPARGMASSHKYCEPRLAYLGKGWKSWSDFLGYRRGASYGEVMIARILDASAVNYQHQVSFQDCCYIKPLKFDFGIIVDSQVLTLIEFHGQQHFDAVPHWGGEDYLTEIRKRDLIKYNYCQSNTIPLLIIKYDEIHDIQEILQMFLKSILPSVRISKEKYKFNVKAYSKWIEWSECRQLCHSLKLSSIHGWRDWCRNHPEHNAPIYPETVYANFGWTNWFDFLGKIRPSPSICT